MEMNERFIGLCLDELKVFHDSLQDDNVPDIPVISEELLTEAKEISKSCILLGSYKSCRTPDIFTQPDFVYFTKEINIKRKTKNVRWKKVKNLQKMRMWRKRWNHRNNQKENIKNIKPLFGEVMASGIHVSLIHFWR